MIKIELPNLEKQLLSIAKSNMNEALGYVKQEVDNKTPEDTKTLLWNNTIEPIIELDTKIIWVVSNDTEYAPYVEFWVWRSFNYNKPKGTIFHVWDWARMFQRTADDEEVKLNLTQILSKW